MFLDAFIGRILDRVFYLFIKYLYTGLVNYIAAFYIGVQLKNKI